MNSAEMEGLETVRPSGNRAVKKRPPISRRSLGLPRHEIIANDHEAFMELQQYADFQNVLSQRVCDDLDNDEPLRQYIDPRMLKHGLSEGPIYAKSTVKRSSSLQALSTPVSITALKRKKELNGWERTYAPSLLEYGLDPDIFLNFIDEFNEIIQELPPFENSPLSVHYSSASEETSDISVFKTEPARPIGLPQLGSRSKIFLDMANHQLFNPHGLQAIIAHASIGKSDLDLERSQIPSRSSYLEKLTLSEDSARLHTRKPESPLREASTSVRRNGKRIRVKSSSRTEGSAPIRRSSRFVEVAPEPVNNVFKTVSWTEQESGCDILSIEEAGIISNDSVPYLVIIDYPSEEDMTIFEPDKSVESKGRYAPSIASNYGIETPVNWAKYRRRREICVPTL